MGAFEINVLVPETCRDQVGSEYNGTVSWTRSWKACQAWSATSPHQHGYTAVGDHNHCRHPEEDVFNHGAWCYTTDPATRWEWCDVPQCSVNQAPWPGGRQGGRGARVPEHG